MSMALNVAAPSSAIPPMEKPASDGKMAQDIRRAYAASDTAAKSARRRTLALGGLAVGLALAMGSVYMGLWGDPSALLGLTGQSSMAVTPPAAAPDVAPAPVVAQEEEVVATPAAQPASDQATNANAASATAVDAQSAAVTAAPAPAAEATAGPPRTPREKPAAPSAALVASVSAPVRQPSASHTVAPTRAVALHNSAPPTTPGFASKMRGPGALEQGYAALLDGRLDDAAQAYGQALRANPDERDALLGMAYIHHQRGQREEAQAYYRQVLRQEPGNAIAMAGLQSLDSGSDPTLTASRARELAARQPDSAAAMAMAGNAFVRDGLLAEAAQAFARAQALESGNPLHAYNHAVALDRLGRHAAALAQYEVVLKLSLTAPTAERAYRIDDVRLRVEQLRNALAATAPASP